MNVSNSYEKISKTAIFTAYPRIFTDIPFSKEIFNELKLSREKEGLGEISDELKVPKLAPELEARYKLVDKLLRQNEATQVLEIASGFSPRGIDWSKDNGIEYVEVELPALIEEKKEIVKNFIKIPENLHFEKGSALNQADLIRAASHFKKDRKIALIHEGLLRYLNFEEKTAVGKNIRALLEIFGGAWITPDITLKKLLQDQDFQVMPGKNEMVSKMTEVKIDQNRFENEEQARKFFESLGFTVERHCLLEMQNELVSPQRLSLSPEEVEAMIGSAVVYVMRLGQPTGV